MAIAIVHTAYGWKWNDKHWSTVLVCVICSLYCPVCFSPCIRQHQMNYRATKLNREFLGDEQLQPLTLNRVAENFAEIMNFSVIVNTLVIAGQTSAPRRLSDPVWIMRPMFGDFIRLWFTSLFYLVLRKKLDSKAILQNSLTVTLCNQVRTESPFTDYGSKIPCHKPESNHRPSA